MRRRVTDSGVAAEAVIDEKRTEVYYWWLILAIFFEYGRPGSFVPVLNAVKANSVIPLGLLSFVLFAGGLRPFRQIFQDRQVRWLTAFMALIVVSVPIADVTERAFNMFIAALGYYFLFLMIARVATSWRRLRGICTALILSHLFLIVMTPDIVTNAEVRSYIEGGTFLGDGNDFALSLCVLIPLSIEVATGGRYRLLRWTAWGSVVLFLLAIVGSQSRGGSLGIACVGLFLWLLSSRKFASLLGILVVGAVMMFHASDAYFERMSSIRNYQTEGSAQGRIMAWKAGMHMAVTNPVFGVGVGHFPIAFGTTHRPREIVGPMPWLNAHSSYFQVLGELGFPGIIVFLALVIGGFRASMAARRRVIQSCIGVPPPSAAESARILYLGSAALVGFAVAGAFLSAAYYPHVFILTALLFSARQIAMSETEAPVTSELHALSNRGRNRRHTAVGGPTLKRRRGYGT